MLCAAINEKGFFCKPGNSGFSAASLELVADACEGHESGRAFAKRLRASCNVSAPSQGPGPYPAGHTVGLRLLPGGYGHTTFAWNVEARALGEAWANLARIRTEWDEVSRCLLIGGWPGGVGVAAAANGQPGLAEAIANIEASIPRANAMALHLASRIIDLEPGWQAEGCDAFAIWMPGAKPGFMSDTKRATGAAGARLFESKEAALFKACALSFGLWRGPAAIVRVRVEVVGIESSDDGASSHAPMMALARREAAELRDCLDSATLGDIARVLGHEGCVAVVRSGVKGSGFAGRDEGYACWIERRAGGSVQGFANAKVEPGSLLGATLKATPGAAAKRAQGAGLLTVVRVACRPVAVESKLGEPDCSELAEAISSEAALAREEALARQTRQGLLDRAEALRAAEGESKGAGSRRL